MHLMGQSRCVIQDGSVKFISDAPLENIVATSKTVRGVIIPEERTFAFTIDISTFQGFNSPLQRVHFNENYMESGTYPSATFAGKFIEDVDLTKDGIYDVRVKGKLKVHGIEKERIIKGHVEVAGSSMHISSTFTVLLEDHNIRIPRVVYQKIAKVVTVEVEATLVSNKS
jgi:polyisoprenoid-binding protein YceI